MLLNCGVIYSMLHMIRRILDILSSWKVLLLSTSLIFCFLTPAKAVDITFEWYGCNLVVSNLMVSSAESYETVPCGLEEGELAYIDRNYIFTYVPGYLLGATYIKTANDDKGSTGTDFLSFDVNQDVTVYVAHDSRITDKPAWLSSFTDTGDNLSTNDASLSIYAKDFPAGTITLGGNEASSMYSVIVVPLQ